MLAHKAAAEAIRTELEKEARREALEGTRVTWSTPGVAAYASLEHSTAVISDPEAFMDYLEQHFPTEVVRREIREVRVQSWLSAKLEEWAKLGPVPPREGALPDELPGVREPDGTVIPGLKFKRGGAFKSLTLRPEGEAKRRLDMIARRYAIEAGSFTSLTLATLEHADEE
jgi:hypothetical protein